MNNILFLAILLANYLTDNLPVAKPETTAGKLKFKS